MSTPSVIIGLMPTSLAVAVALVLPRLDGAASVVGVVVAVLAAAALGGYVGAVRARDKNRT